MQRRQQDRYLYFQELAQTSRKYYVPYIKKYKNIQGIKVLEVGCGDGGNLLPFSEMGCVTTGVDIDNGRIKDATRFFGEQQTVGHFIASDVFRIKGMEHAFDLIICHDVIEHIEDKATFLSKLRSLLQTDGLMFIAFPAWQMPFGGHQQICQSRIISHFPFIHLLPSTAYKAVLKWAGESDQCISELLFIKKTRTPIELFERLIRKEHMTIINRTFFFINPHYETKFGLIPRILPTFIKVIPYFRNYCTTSCFYLLK